MVISKNDYYLLNQASFSLVNIILVNRADFIELRERLIIGAPL